MKSPLRHLLSLLLFFTAFSSALPRTSFVDPSETPLLPAATPPPSLASQTTPSTSSLSPPTAAPTVPGIQAAAQPDFRPEDGPPDYDALIPADPDAEPRRTANLADYGLTQVTYYSCATFAATTHCGWHRPLVPVDSAAPPKIGLGLATLAGVCGLAVLIFIL